MKEKTYSTVQVARILGVSWSTLHRWIESGKIQAPAVQALAGLQIRLWTESDLTAAKKYKAENYRKKPRHKNKTGAN